MFEREIRDTAFVPRWSIVRVSRQQSIAEHAYFVAIYSDQIAEILGWEGPRDALFRYALMHDADEILSGDIAGPAKKILKKAVGVSIHIFDNWLFQQMKRRIPDFERWVRSTGSNLRWDEDIKAIIKIADILESVLFLVDEQFIGNRFVTEHKEYLEDTLYKLLQHFKSHTKLADLNNAITLAIRSAGSEPSMIVTGDEAIR